MLHEWIAMQQTANRWDWQQHLARHCQNQTKTHPKLSCPSALPEITCSQFFQTSGDSPYRQTDLPMSFPPLSRPCPLGEKGLLYCCSSLWNILLIKLRKPIYLINPLLTSVIQKKKNLNIIIIVKVSKTDTILLLGTIRCFLMEEHWSFIMRCSLVMLGQACAKALEMVK